MPWTTDVMTTDRLVLRCATDADRPAIVRILTDPDVRRHLGGPVSNDVIEGFNDRTIGEQWGAFVATFGPNGPTIGTFSLDAERGEYELSYQLLPEYWGQGFAFEASEELLAWGWSTLDVDSIIAVTQTTNERSLRLLSSLGFVLDREFEEYGEPQTQMRLSRPSSAPSS